MEPYNLPSQFAIFVVLVMLSRGSIAPDKMKLTKLDSASVICYNNGTPSATNNSHCECFPPWTGDFCTDYACVNGLSTGSQYDENSILFSKRCICDAGFTGELCDIRLTEICGPHGSLIDDECSCFANYTGPNCQFVDHCLHGELSSGRCNCDYGWSSDFCDKIICHRGFSNEIKSKCICDSGYRGTFCDICAEQDASPYPECLTLRKNNFFESKLVIIVVVAILTLLFLSCLMIIAIFVLRRKQQLKRRRNGEARNDGSKQIQLMGYDDEHDNL